MKCLMIILIAALLCHLVHDILIDQKFQEPLKYQHLQWH